MQNQFAAAINQICEEKNIPKEVVVETIEAALAAAYKKDYGSKNQEVRVELSEETGEATVFVSKEVVDTVEDEYTQITLADAKKVNKDAKVGDMVEVTDTPGDFGRIAAQTAKQVIIQRIREAERDIVFGEYKDKEGEVINGTVQRIEGNNAIIDLGKASGILFPNEQIPDERYYIGQRSKYYVVRVEQNSRGPQIVLSRSHPGLVKRLFEMEVPEILAGIVEIKSIAREAGQRTKMAVYSNQEGVDAVGSCVGQRGVRVQAVMNEIGEEKVDIILWNEDPKTFIANALSPAKINEITLNEEEKKATVKVAEDQLSLAIGKQGQNVRLAAKLTGWNVDIEGGDEAGVEAAAGANLMRPVEDKRDLDEEILKAVESSAGPETEESAEPEIKIEDSTEAPVENKPTTEQGETPASEDDQIAGEIISEEKTADQAEEAVSEVEEATSLNEIPQSGADEVSISQGEPTPEEKEKTEATTTDSENGIDEVAQILEEEQKDAS